MPTSVEFFNMALNILDTKFAEAVQKVSEGFI